VYRLAKGVLRFRALLTLMERTRFLVVRILFYKSFRPALKAGGRLVQWFVVYTDHL